MLSSTGYEAVGYFRSRYQPDNETHPDIQLLLVTSLYGSALSNDRLKTLRTKLNMNSKVTRKTVQLYQHAGPLLSPINNSYPSLVIKQSKACKFMPKMQKNTFGGWAVQCPPTCWEAYVPPKPPSHTDTHTHPFNSPFLGLPR